MIGVPPEGGIKVSHGAKEKKEDGDVRIYDL
jgi:hypothetical protein